MSLSETDQNIRSLFNKAEALRKETESSWDTRTPTYQDSLFTAVATYDACRRLADQLSLFSPNEALEDISSSTLQYLLVDYWIAELTLKFNTSTTSDRKQLIEKAARAYDRFLGRLDAYEILSAQEKQLYQQHNEDPGKFSTASTTNASARRTTKIARFREEKDLKAKLEHIRLNPRALESDDAALRDLYLTEIHFYTHSTFSSLESISQELQILSLAPPSPQPEMEAPRADTRDRSNMSSETYSDRLDMPMSQLLGRGNKGPILSKDGKPLRPFTLLDNRTRLRDGVFKSGHNLPTMTIDEYLDEEMKRGGIIEGGGASSGIAPEVDEDDHEKADEATMKAREWDEYTEANPKEYIEPGMTPYCLIKRSFNESHPMKLNQSQGSHRGSLFTV